MRTPPRAAAVLVAAVFTLPGPSTAEPPAERNAAPAFASRAAAARLDPVALLQRAGEYVTRYADTFRNVVAEESCRQWWREGGHTTSRTFLRSDLVFVAIPGSLPWTMFRDVYEVDGQKLRDREARLQKLFSAPTQANLEAAGGSTEVILGTLRFLPAFAMLSVAPAAAQDVPSPIPVFPAAVENVNVDVFVSRGGRRVEGLTASDFVLTDQGVVQNVEIVAGQQAAIDVVLALDISGSVAGLRLRSLRKGAHQFVDRLLPIDSLTVLVFSSDLLLPVRAGANRAEAHAAIDRFAGAGATSLTDAVHAALLLSDPARGRPLVLVFSDGVDRGSWLTPEAVIDEARASDVVAHYVETPSEDKQPFLEQLANETGGRGWRVGRDAGLEKAFTTALDEFRGRYRLRYEPQGVPAGGWHELKVRLKGRKADVQARRGYRSRSGGTDAR